MTWYELVHKINTNIADAYLKADSNFEKEILQASQKEMYELLKVETLARIATALEKLADCDIDIHSEDYIEENE